MIVRQLANLVSQSLYHRDNVEYKRDNVHLFVVDLETELKTILYDTFCKFCE